MQFHQLRTECGFAFLLHEGRKKPFAKYNQSTLKYLRNNNSFIICNYSSVVNNNNTCMFFSFLHACIHTYE